MDSGFATFVNLLAQPGDAIQKLPNEAVHGAIAHYSHVIPVQNVSMFIRVVVTSPSLWSIRPWAHLIGTQAAIRQAFRLRLASIKKVTPGGYIFGPNLASPLGAWVDAVFDGLSSIGTAIAHLHASISILSGLALALDDVHKDVALPKSQYKIDRELVSACAGAIRFHASVEKDAWGKEFKSLTPNNERMTHFCALFPM